TSADVRDVWVAGEQIVANHSHRQHPNVAQALRTAIDALL
ncbi:MAG: hypothetical protein RLZZ534_850, partial [Actinomycetota bacterium]